MTEESERLSQSRIIQTDQKLVEFAKGTARTNRLQDLIVEEGETVVLSYTSDKFKRFYQKIKPESVDHLKELMGVPRQFQKTRSSIRNTSFTCVPGSSSSLRKSSVNIFSRMISPAVLTDDKSPEEDKIEARKFAREAARQYIYGDSAEVIHQKPLIEKYLELRDMCLFIPMFKNITVYNEGTLSISANTYVVRANRVRLYGTGQIVCDGPTTFDCLSFEGKLFYMAKAETMLMKK